MKDFSFYYAIFLLVLNAGSFWLVGWDKYKARKNKWRIPERRFFILGLFGGAPGVYIGMQLFRHKTQHRKFTIGIPLLIILNLISGYYLYIYIVTLFL